MSLRQPRCEVSLDEHIRYKKGEQLEKVFEFAINQRNWEIEQYYKRAAYYWTITAVAFTAYGWMLRSSEPIDPWLRLGICILGGVFAFSWYLINRANSYWHHIWDFQVKKIGGKVYGGMFDPQLKGCQLISLGPYSFPVTVIHECLGILIIGVWTILALYEVGKSWDLPQFWRAFLMGAFGVLLGLTWVVSIIRGIRRRSQEDWGLTVMVPSDSTSDSDQQPSEDLKSQHGKVQSRTNTMVTTAR